jgi:hypothetical protein
MQDGRTAFIVSGYGHTETLALLLSNKADAATKVQQFKIFKYLQLIDNELQDLNIAFFI